MQVTDTVRVVRTAGLVRSVLFATVLSVQPPHPDDDGTNGEPTITIAYLDPARVSLLGTPRWAEAFHRVPTVRHVSHADVQSGAEEFCYTEVLPSDGMGVHLQRVNMDAEDGPPADAAEAPDTIGTIVYINHSNGLEVLHTDVNQFTVPSNRGLHQFTDLFSAKVYVDAQPKADEAAKQQQAVGLQPSAADLDAVAAEEKAAEETGGAQLAIETAEQDSYPGPATTESISEQDEHDRATGNVNEANQTPAEAVAAEQQQQ